MVRRCWASGEEGLLRPKASGTVLEELLLPEVVQRGRELMLVAEVRDRHAVDQVTLEDGDLLDGCIVSCEAFAW